MACDKVVQGKKKERNGGVGVDESVEGFTRVPDEKKDDGNGEGNVLGIPSV